MQMTPLGLSPLLLALVAALLPLACQPQAPTPEAEKNTAAPPVEAPALAPEAKPAPQEDPVIASSGPVQVKLSDYDRALRRMALFSPQPKARALPSELIQAPHFQHNTALNVLSIRMMRQMAQAQGLQVSEDEVERALEAQPRLAHLAVLDPTARERLLDEYGLDLSDLRQVLADRVLSQKLAQALLDKISQEELWRAWRNQNARTEIAFIAVPNTPSSQAITDFLQEHGDQIEAHYQEKLSQYQLPPARQARLLWRAVPGDASPQQRQQTQELLQSLRTRALAGEDFATLAREHSQHSSAEQGGDLGFVVAKQRPEAFELEPGQISEVRSDPKGMYLLKVERALPRRQQELTRGLRREIAAELLRASGPLPGPTALAQRMVQAWSQQDQVEPPGPQLQALLQEGHLRPGKSLPFPNDAPREAFIPGIGSAPEIMDAIGALSLKAPVHPKPLVFRDHLYVIALKSRTQARRAQFEAEGEEFARRWKASREPSIVQDMVQAQQQRDKLELDLRPVAQRYGVLRHKPPRPGAEPPQAPAQP